MRHRRMLYITSLCLLVVALLLAACGPFGGNPSSTSTVGNLSTRVVSTNPTIDQLVRNVLVNMQQHAWNPRARTGNVVTGGLYINWKMSNPSLTNAVRPGPDGNPQHNHDPQVDLFYLSALAQYHQLHPQDHSFDNDIAQMTSVVLAEFGAYSVPKGWIYFYLLNDGLLLHNRDLVNEAHTTAVNFFDTWYVPSRGLVYDKSHSPGDYAQVLQSLFRSGLWDSARGGLYFAIDMKQGLLLTDYKETRSQTLVLLALHHFNQVSAQFTQQERQLTAVITDHFYQATYHGFFYRVKSDFQVYVSRPNAGIGVEDYFTTEAMGSALDALQATELP